MLVEDKTKYCWVDNGNAGIPQDSIKDAIADYLEYISYFDDVARNSDIEWVRVGHPCRYVPKIDSERVLWNLIEYDMDDEIKEWSYDYMKDVKSEHIDELSQELTNVFQAWETRHGYKNDGFVVLGAKTYRIGDYVKE